MVDSSAFNSGPGRGESAAGERTYRAWIVYDHLGDMFSHEDYPDAGSARYMAVLAYNSWKGTSYNWRQLYNRGYRCELSTVVAYPAPAAPSDKDQGHE